MIRFQARAPILLPLLVVALTGLGFLAGGAWAFYYQYRIVSQWPQADAEVTQSYVHRWAARNRARYRAEWEFRYTVGDREFRVPVQSGTKSSSLESRKREADQFPVGSHHLVRYDPENPSHMELRADYSFRFFLIPVIFLPVGLAVTLLSAWLMVKLPNHDPRLECASCREPLERVYKFCPRCAMKIPLRERVSGIAQIRLAARNARTAWIPGAVFSVVGLTILGIGLWIGLRSLRVVRDWPEVNAEVVKNSIVRSRRTNGDFYYRIRPEFRYSAAGREITAAAANSGFDSGNYSDAVRRADHYAAGTLHRIRWNPANPRDIRFDAGYTLEFFAVALISTALGLILAGLGAAMLVTTVPKGAVCAACQMPVGRAGRYCPFCGVAQAVPPVQPV